MKRFRFLTVVTLVAAVFGSAGCSEKMSEGAMSVTSEKSEQAEQPKQMVSKFHSSKEEAKSLAESFLWEYFEAVDHQDTDKVMGMLSDELRTMYDYQDRIVYRNIASAKVKRIYDMTHQFPPTQFAEARYFYVEVEYQTNHLYDSNDKDGIGYRMAIVAREKQDSPYKLMELSHTPQLKEVPINAPEAPNTSITPFTNPKDKFKMN